MIGYNEGDRVELDVNYVNPRLGTIIESFKVPSGRHICVVQWDSGKQISVDHYWLNLIDTVEYKSIW